MKQTTYFVNPSRQLLHSSITERTASTPSAPIANPALSAKEPRIIKG
ncbi:hypothetical protein [Pseudothauera hydrothermalis]|nr:hypothetical protein [Pseudothauera hydrothermalis]